MSNLGVTPPKPPVRTFIPASLGAPRITYFNDVKKVDIGSSLNITDKLILEDSWNLIMILSGLITEDGLNVHFGTQTKNQADFVLLFVGAANQGLDDSGEYYLLDDSGRLRTISKETADDLKGNYQLGIGEKLHKQRTARNSKNTLPDTNYIYFENSIINEIIDEVIYYLRVRKIKSTYIRITSFTENDQQIHPLPPYRRPSLYLDRLTIQFGYTDNNDSPVSLEDIDPGRHRETRDAQRDKEKLSPSGYDTGMPVPPYPGGD